MVVNYLCVCSVLLSTMNIGTQSCWKFGETENETSEIRFNSRRDFHEESLKSSGLLFENENRFWWW